MKLIRLTCSYILLASVGASAQAVRPDVSAFSEIVSIARNRNIPIGIIRSTGDGLCQKTNFFMQSETQDARALVKKIATKVSYQVWESDQVLVLAPKTLSPKLKAITTTKFANFPGQTGPISSMGEVLQGWVRVKFDGAKGFANNQVEPSVPEADVLPPLTNMNAVEIANKIVDLPPKGMWVLEERGASSNGRAEIRLATFSYQREARQIERLTCNVP